MSTDSILELNIGGTVFKVPKSTLTNLDGYFKTMLETDVSVTKDESGRIFIDRSPKNFKSILKFMREGRVNFPKSKKKVLEILKEAQYYMLIGLVEQCNCRLPSHCKIVVENDEDRYKEAEKMLKTDQANDIVKLDIGGTIYQTTKLTLMKFDGFFRTMLETDIPVTTDESGCIIINRDPKHFETILNYMRDGDVAIQKIYDEDIRKKCQEIIEEADYYMLDCLVELCKEKIPIELPAKLKIIKNEKKFKKLIKNVRSRPTLIIDYFADFKNHAFPSDIAEFSSFVEKNNEKFEIYFKPFHTPKTGNPNPTSNSYRIFEYGYVEYEGNFDDVNDGIDKCVEYKPREYESDDSNWSIINGLNRWDHDSDDDYDDDPFKNYFYAHMWRLHHRM